MSQLAYDLNECQQFIVDGIARILFRIGNHGEGALSPQQIRQVPIVRQIREKVRVQERLTFVLPAFPAKSSNPLKTSGPLPDLGEVLGLRALNSFCEDINRIYAPGAEVWICSDGRVFNDLVGVSDEDLLGYMSSIQKIIANFGLKNIHHFSLEDGYGDISFAEMRQKLTQEFGESLDAIRAKVKTQEEFRFLFNGLHKFIKEDRAYLVHATSRSAEEKKCKQIAYQVMQRSGAWDKCLEKHFPNVLRLSIHPYPLFHHKFGIKLVSSSSRWATPWHNVVLKKGTDWQLMRRHEAVAFGAKLKFFRGEYAYFEF